MAMKGAGMGAANRSYVGAYQFLEKVRISSVGPDIYCLTRHRHAF